MRSFLLAICLLIGASLAKTFDLSANRAFAIASLNKKNSTASTCTKLSFKQTSLTVEDFTYYSSSVSSNSSSSSRRSSRRSSSSSSSFAAAEFTLVNHAAGYKTYCAGNSTGTGLSASPATEVFQCDLKPPVGVATFSFSKTSGLLSVNTTWVCPDSEDEFTASAKALVNQTCSQTKLNAGPKTDDVTCKPVKLRLPIQTESVSS